MICSYLYYLMGVNVLLSILVSLSAHSFLCSGDSLFLKLISFLFITLCFSFDNFQILLILLQTRKKKRFCPNFLIPSLSVSEAIIGNGLSQGRATNRNRRPTKYFHIAFSKTCPQPIQINDDVLIFSEHRFFNK